MKTDEELKKMDIKELKRESSKYWAYVRKIDSLANYQEIWEKK